MQSHSRQQVENLTQQLVQRSNQLQEADTDRRQLQQKVQMLERYTCGHYVLVLLMHMYTSSKLQEFKSTQHRDSNLQSSNTQLEQKVTA